MPFALVIIGLILIVAGAKDTYRQLGAELQSDFTGPGNFTYWLAAILIVGSIGYADRFRRVSHLFLALIVIVMVLKNGGFFDKFRAFLASGPIAPAPSGTKVASAGGVQDNGTFSFIPKSLRGAIISQETGNFETDPNKIADNSIRIGATVAKFVV